MAYGYVLICSKKVFLAKCPTFVSPPDCQYFANIWQSCPRGVGQHSSNVVRYLGVQEFLSANKIIVVKKVSRTKSGIVKDFPVNPDSNGVYSEFIIHMVPTQPFRVTTCISPPYIRAYIHDIRQASITRT